MIRLGIVSLLAIAMASPPDPTPRPKTHGYGVTGRITAVDEGQKTFVVKNAAGKETKLVWTSATQIVGGKLKAGEKVTLRYFDKDGKHIATTVSLGEPLPAKAPSVPATTPTPVPAR